MQPNNTYNSYDYVTNYFEEKNSCVSKLFDNQTNKNIKRIIKIVYKNIEL